MKERKKWVTIRLGDQRCKYSKGDKVTLTIGWNDNEKNTNVGQVEIARVSYKRIKDITRNDIYGESPDCTQKEAIPFVLSAIYRRVVSDEDCVTIIKWKYL